MKKIIQAVIKTRYCHQQATQSMQKLQLEWSQQRWNLPFGSSRPLAALLFCCAIIVVFRSGQTAAQVHLERPRVRQLNTDWRTLDISEAFPGSLADLDNPQAQNGGVSGIGTGNKGNFSINSKGQMAITFVQGISAQGDVVIGRSFDGTKWERHLIKDVDMRNSQRMSGNGMAATISFSYWGPGPQVQIDDNGDICIACLIGDELATFMWPANEAQLRPGDRIRGDIPVERCPWLQFDRQIASFDLYEHRGRFYLVTTPQSHLENFVRVYELRNKQWQLIGEAIPGIQGSIGWDDANTDLYVGVRQKRKNTNGSYPAVFRLDTDLQPARWQELTSPASGLRETFGIDSYSGGRCPFIFAHEHQVWAFWWQEDQHYLQGAIFKDQRWQSCAKAVFSEWSISDGWHEAEHDSFGQGGGLCLSPSNWVPQTAWILTFRDEVAGDIVIYACDGQVGLVIHNGRTYPTMWRRQIKAGESPKYSNSLLAEGAGRGFYNMINTRDSWPHTVRSVKVGGALYLQATLTNGDPSTSDVFVYKLTPRPFYDFGAVFGADDHTGLLVKSLSPDSLAQRADIHVGDHILRAGDSSPESNEMQTADEFFRAVRFADRGRLPIKLKRDGQEIVVNVNIAADN